MGRKPDSAMQKHAFVGKRFLTFFQGSQCFVVLTDRQRNPRQRQKKTYANRQIEKVVWAIRKSIILIIW